MRPIAISLSPNTDRDDVVLARQVLSRPDTWQNQSIVPDVAASLGRLLPNHLIALTSSGRSALYSLLKAYDIKAGDEVIIQAFTCIAVPEPILWRHATPVYVDIEPGTYTMSVADLERKITPKTKAIIVQHTFGIPAPIKQIMAIARAKNIIVIEDCAHALGSQIDGQMLGTFGDAAIFSFGRDKMFSSVFGGAVATANQSILAKVLADQAQLPLPPAGWVRQQLRHPLIFALAVSLYNTANIGKYMIAAARDLNIISRAVTTDERHGGMPDHIRYRYSPALAYLLKNQLAKFDDYTARRQSFGQRYFSGLANLASALPSVRSDSQVAWLRFPLLVQNQPAVMQAAKQAGILLGDWYDTPLAPRDSSLSDFQYQEGTCPVAEETAKHVINVPTYPLMTDEQVDQVIAFAKQHCQPYHLKTL
jgi:dTDP-4-amino-4,6-dideoxygalactose transaminase